MGHAILKGGNSDLVDFVPLVCEFDIDHTAILLVSFPNHHALLFQPVHNSCQVADGNHHLGPHLAEGQPARIADRGQNIILGWSEVHLLKVFLKLLVGEYVEAEESDPEAITIVGQKRPFHHAAV